MDLEALLRIARACASSSDGNGNDVFRINEDIWGQQLNAEKLKAVGQMPAAEWSTRKAEIVTSFASPLKALSATELTATALKVPMTHLLCSMEWFVFLKSHLDKKIVIKMPPKSTSVFNMSALICFLICFLFKWTTNLSPLRAVSQNYSFSVCLPQTSHRTEQLVVLWSQQATNASGWPMYTTLD